MAEPTFEELVARLEERVKALEEGNIPLEEALAAYEEGAALVGQIRTLLADAELRVQRLRENLQEGESFREELEPYDPDPPADPDAAAD